MLTCRIFLVILAAVRSGSEAPPSVVRNSSATPAAPVLLLQQATQQAAGNHGEVVDDDEVGSGGSEDDSAAESGHEDSVDEGDDSSEIQSQSLATTGSKSRKPKAKAKAKKGKGGKGGKASDNEVKDASLIRPNSGKRPDVVEVEIIMKDFRGVAFTANVFEADLILISRWRDDRTKDLLQQKGAKRTLNLPPADAKRTLWMPDIEVLNREYDGLDILSSVVQVKPDGVVEKIERSHARLKVLFHTNAFPYDTQTLKVKVASNSKMADDVVLKTHTDDEDMPGVLKGAFDKDDLFDYMSSEMRDYLETDGPLTKSRAELLVTIRRNMASCYSTILVPAFCIVSISWAGFFMPCGNPAFAMPRVTTSFVSFLMQVNLDNRIDKLQPARGDASWLDIWQEANEICVYAAVVFTIAVLYIAFYLEDPELGSSFDQELQILLPLVSLIIMLVCYTYVGSTKTYQLSSVTRSVLFLAFGGYSAYMLWRLRRTMAAKMPPPSKEVAHMISLPPPHPPPHPIEVPVEVISSRVVSSPPHATQTLPVAEHLFQTSPNLHHSDSGHTQVWSEGLQPAPIQSAPAAVLPSPALQPVLAPESNPAAAVQNAVYAPARPM